MGTLSGTTNGKRNLNFLDLGFANDILIFAGPSHEIMTLVDKLVEFLGDGCQKLNAEKKTVLITTQAQPQPFLIPSTGTVVRVMQTESGHKWLGYMLPADGSKHATLDIHCHLQSASRTFLANK